ncbi:DnaD domain-containing protein [Viridibacillus sp. YIM B01967]|uniref:DnaD domain-containing protein n=1 Tax=Viridibacillus soli TaxID=2798301 RepID=A0ABS1HBW3_9BACL|nr:DnaD domain-containing protein [Viridibacillus soli]MBK3496754.1 DnaD domain-containing protein [Viridibacillus soli]
MTNEADRLRIWIEQGNVSISHLFFQFYKELGIKDSEAMLLMHLTAFHEEGNEFPTPTAIANRMQMTEDEIASSLQRLMQKGILEILQKVDELGVLFETINLQPLWTRLVDCVLEKKVKKVEDTSKLKEGELFNLFEQEFGRFLSPMETETISMWLDQDGHSPEVIRKALVESVLSQKLSLRYVDRILFEWKKKNVKTTQDAEKLAQNFRQNTVPQRSQSQQNSHKAETQQTKKVPFYNWLEERE